MPKAIPAKGKKGPSSALTRALRFEKQGKRFFTAAAAKAADPYARRMFELLAGMEDKHIQDILAISGKLQENDGKFPAVSATPHESRMRLFKRETARIRKETLVSWDAATTMRRALGFEAEGREMYRRMAETSSHAQERKFFKLLSAEEQSHFEIIYEYLDSFENVGLRMRED